MAGIHRPVELVLRPPHADILDYRVEAAADGSLSVQVHCREAGYHAGGASKRQVVARLYADQADVHGDDFRPGECLWTRTTAVATDEHGCSACLSDKVLVDGRPPLQWTAETPNLYTLTLSLVVYDRAGVATTRQIESCRVGFRTVSIKNGRVLINSRAITVCGMVRRDRSFPKIPRLHVSSCWLPQYWS